MELNQEDIKNLLAIIARVDIKGSEATAVAILQQKLNGMVTVDSPVAEEVKDDTLKEVD